MEAVLLRQLDMVYRIAVTQAGNKADAEDITQEVFLEYVRRQPVFASAEHEKAWFIRVTLHRARNLFQTAWRRRRADKPETGQGADGELGGDVHTALLSLPDETRVIITLFYYERMEVPAIAHALGISETAARKRLQRGREKLRILLGGEDDDKQTEPVL